MSIKYINTAFSSSLLERWVFCHSHTVCLIFALQACNQKLSSISSRKKWIRPSKQSSTPIVLLHSSLTHRLSSVFTDSKSISHSSTRNAELIFCRFSFLSLYLRSCLRNLVSWTESRDVFNEEATKVRDFGLICC